MTLLSKPLVRSIPFNCYEIAHTWTPNCLDAALFFMGSAFIESLKMYSLVYFALQIFSRKYSWKDFLHTLFSIFVSSTFLSLNVSTIMYFVCLCRKWLGKFYSFSCFLPTFISCFLTILIERKSRRGAAVFYVANCASETLFNMAVARGLITPFPHGEVFLFATAFSLYCYMLRKQRVPKDILSWIIRYIFGDEKTKGKGINGIPKNYEAKVVSSDAEGDIMNHNGRIPTSVEDQLSTNTFHRWMKTRHWTCPHKFGCAYYSVLFIKCLLRWLFNEDKAEFVLPAAFIGALFMKFSPSSTLALCFMWKTIESLCNYGVESGVVPKIPGFMILLFAISGAVTVHAAIVEPHNVRPRYYHFLRRLTNNKVDMAHRQLLDRFGTHASKLYSDFWPDLDLRHVSKVYQETVLPWLIT